MGLRPAQSRLQALPVKRLQQVVDGLHIKRIDGETFMGGGKDYPRTICFGEFREHLQPVAPGQLHVQKNQVKWCAPDEGDRLDAVAAFANNLDGRFRAQQAAQALASERFVINNEDTEHAHTSPVGNGVRENGGKQAAGAGINTTIMKNLGGGFRPDHFMERDKKDKRRAAIHSFGPFIFAK